MATRSSETRSKILIFKKAAFGFVADIGGLYAAFDAERERPDVDVAAVCTEPACEERMDTGEGSCDDASEEREAVFASWGSISSGVRLRGISRLGAGECVRE